MAILVNTGTFECVGDTPVLVIAENADRTALLIDILTGGPMSFANADETAYEDGLVWSKARGPLIDNVVQNGDVWAVLAASNKRATGTFCEWYDDGL
jgi:hypothetical protein